MRLALCAAIAATVSSSSFAALIAVPQASFETPNVKLAAPYFQEFSVDAANVFGRFERSGPTFNAVYEAARYGGNPTGLDGTQAATVGAAAFGGIFMDATNYTTPDPTLIFTANTQYTMTVGIGRRTDSPAQTNTALDFRLFYRTAANTGANVLVSGTTTVGGVGGPISGVLTDYTVTVFVPAGSAAVGKPIGIWFPTSTPGTLTGNRGDFVVDNIRLDAVVAVPEPTALGMVALAAVAGLRRRRA